MLRNVLISMVLAPLFAGAVAAAEPPCRLHCETPACRAGEVRLSCHGGAASAFHVICSRSPALLAVTTGGQSHSEDGIEVAYAFDRQQWVEASFVWSGVLATTTTPAEIQRFVAGLGNAERLHLRVGARQASFDLRALATSDRRRIAQACGASPPND